MAHELVVDALLTHAGLGAGKRVQDVEGPQRPPILHNNRLLLPRHPSSVPPTIVSNSPGEATNSSHPPSSLTRTAHPVQRPQRPAPLLKINRARRV
ncbi:hypothetical protein B0H12DRAFT_1229813 [Mycena haematopus]|nr:hypothetical protein B0H12DRAFT_1229813 [Mycena haematopus]